MSAGEAATWTQEVWGLQLHRKGISSRHLQPRDLARMQAQCVYIAEIFQKYVNLDIS